LIVALGPILGFFQLKAAYDIADQVESRRVRRPQEIQEMIGLAAPCAEMDIGNPDAAKSRPGNNVVH